MKWHKNHKHVERNGRDTDIEPKYHSIHGQLYYHLLLLSGLSEEQPGPHMQPYSSEVVMLMHAQWHTD